MEQWHCHLTELQTCHGFFCVSERGSEVTLAARSPGQLTRFIAFLTFLTDFPFVYALNAKTFWNRSFFTHDHIAGAVSTIIHEQSHSRPTVKANFNAENCHGQTHPGDFWIAPCIHPTCSASDANVWTKRVKLSIILIVQHPQHTIFTLTGTLFRIYVYKLYIVWKTCAPLKSSILPHTTSNACTSVSTDKSTRRIEMCGFSTRC